SDLSARLAEGALASDIERRVHEEKGRGVVRAINATGVVLHTGLGRSPVHPEVAEAMGRAAAGYCVLEVDRFTGARNQRDDRLSELLQRLTGAEAAIAVNNNAAAAFLTMHTFAAGREAIVSRGELVEIGGSFRIPDVMQAAGVTLVEVGATNRTRIADYERAIGPETGLLMKVHSSNFRMIGFTEEVPMHELAQLGGDRAVPTAFDLGSGRLEADRARTLDMLGGETQVRDAVASGIELVSFSGDKLLGGPQAGLLVGTAQRISAVRKNPIYRAVRLDKVALAGLEATLQLLLAGRGDEIPARAMLLASADDLRPWADQLAGELSGLVGMQTQVVREQSEPGSGSAPGIYLDTWAVRVVHDTLSADRLAARLRAGEPPVFARIQDGALLLDPRTLQAGEHGLLLEAFIRALA
ncbi:MAG: L-seryl-tRNA(Sec) selenium transferase, partial [Planctomycetota bacterium]